LRYSFFPERTARALSFDILDKKGKKYKNTRSLTLFQQLNQEKGQPKHLGTFLDIVLVIKVPNIDRDNIKTE
jgi:hypothetical protein